MGKLKKLLAVTAALLICSGTMAYMPQDSFINANTNTAYAAEESVEINETNFPDEIFRQFVAEKYDTDGDDMLSATELNEPYSITVSNMGISDLTGIKYFTSLNSLICSSNKLTSLDVSKNSTLVSLICKDNALTQIDVSNAKYLITFYCDRNQLTSLDFSKNRQISASCEDNTYVINLKNNKFDLSTLPTGFDVSKTSEWTNGTVEGNILTVEDDTKAVTYRYETQKTRPIKFTLLTENFVDESVTPPTDEPTLPLGDINSDNAIDSSDASKVLETYALISTGKDSELTEVQKTAADVNKDGSIDSSDASIILAYYSYTQTGGTGTLEDYLNS